MNPDHQPQNPPLAQALGVTTHEGEDRFQRLVAFSAWMLLVLYEKNRLNDEEFDKAINWNSWKESWRFEGVRLREYLESEVFPELESMSGKGHPLALVPAALRGIPDGILKITLLRVKVILQKTKNYNDPSVGPPLDEMLPIWEQWLDELPVSERGGNTVPCMLADFIARTLSVSAGEKFGDLFARDGAVAGMVAKAASDMVLYDQTPALAVIAAAQVLRRGHFIPKLRVYCGFPFQYQETNGRLDAIVGIPPWGMMISHGKRTKRSEFLFLEYVMDHLADGGRAAVVMPHSFLFGGAARNLRERLLKEFRVDAVVNLPDKPVFQVGLSRTVKKISVKSAILYFTKAASRENVWMVSEEEFYELVEGGDYGSSEEESLITAIQARQGLKPERELEGRKVAFWEWINHLMLDIADPGPFGIQDHLLSYRMISLANEFYNGPENVGQAEGANLIPIGEIIRRDFELLPPRGTFLEYEKFLSLAAGKHGAKVLPLSEIAEIKKGRHFRPDEIVKGSAFLEEEIGLARPSDLRKAFNKSPIMGYSNVKLTPEAASSVRDSDLLKDDDILFCIVGDAGKVVLYKPADLMLYEPKMVASERLAIIRIRDEFKTPVNPYFLAALLRSGPYRNRLLAHSTGSTIRQLQVNDLMAIPVPVFSPAERIRLWDELQQDEASLDQLIAALESRPKSSEAIQCFSSGPEWRQFSELPLETPMPDVRANLARLIATRGTDISTKNREPDDTFSLWMRLFIEAAKNLEEILSYPPGTDQLAALHGWRSSARDPGRPFRSAWNGFVNALYQDTKGIRNTIRERCDKLFAKMWTLSIMASDALLNDIKINATLCPLSVPANEAVEATVMIKNRGPLPLRKVRLDGDGIEDQEIPILPSEASQSWNVMLDPLPVGRHTLNLYWKAIRLDERSAGGSIELAIDVADTNERTGLLELGESPYVYARVLDEMTENVFFGRKKAIQQILAAISKRDASTIVLVEGNRRIGKTSLLKYFIRHHLPNDRVPVFINFQDFDGETGSSVKPGIPTRKIFEGMAKELVDAAARACPDLDLPKLGKVPVGNPFRLKTYSSEAVTLIDPDAPFASFRQLAEIVRAQIQPKSLLLIFDEFDRLQEGIESGITSDQVPENLRHLFQSWNDVSGIFTGSRSIRRLRQEYWNILFGLGETVRLSGLDRDEAGGLIEEPVKDRLVYTPKAVDEICRLTARQPLLIQGICERIFRNSKETGRQSVDLSTVEMIAARFADENEHFESIWAYIGSDRQRLLTFLIDQQEAAMGGTTFEQLRDLLEECGIRITVRALHADLEDLEDLEVIGKQQQTGVAKYRIEIPLFACWLRGTKDFSEFRAAAREE